MIKLVSVEGLDCVGKSTFCNIFKNHLENEIKYIYKDNVNIMVQHFPYYECPTGERIKAILNTDGNGVNRKMLAELFVENMKEWKNLVYDKIEDTEDKLTLIICDRYMLSTHLYYLPYVDDEYRESEMKRILMLQKNAELIPPKLTFILEADPYIQTTRLKEKSNKHQLFETLQTQKLLWNNFYSILEQHKSLAPGLHIHIVTDLFIEDYAKFFGNNSKITERIKEFPIWLASLYIQYIAAGRFKKVDKDDKIMKIIFNLHRFKTNLIKETVLMKGFDFDA